MLFLLRNWEGFGCAGAKLSCWRLRKRLFILLVHAQAQFSQDKFCACADVKLSSWRMLERKFIVRMRFYQ
jgi:hypothetical protein